MKNDHTILDQLHGGLIVSCQAPEQSPLNVPAILAAFAATAERTGAANVRAAAEMVRIPVLGLERLVLPGFDVYITPTQAALRRIIDAGFGANEKIPGFASQ
jgi:N-acylglucosamine-6-phosphate 2-epimerase